MKQPVLLVLAAGMGSRYGGLKQLEPVGAEGQLIIDYSLFDAKRAGFEEVIFVIREEMQEAFDETIAKRVGSKLGLSYAYQKLEDLPDGFTLPSERKKPWGTAHAALSARELISSPFAIINADDFYGAEAFVKVYDHLQQSTDHALVAYALENTVTEHGTVSRGVCDISPEGYLQSVVERTHIASGAVCPRYSLDKGETWTDIPGETIVSMNLWGFQESYLTEAKEQFVAFLEGSGDPLTKEFYLPSVADTLISQGRGRVKVLSSGDLWYGITYPQDRPSVVSALESMTASGKYPKFLWR